MASGDGTRDGLGREGHTRTKSLGKASQENKVGAVVESQPSPKKNQAPQILPTLNVAQDHTLSKGKQALQDSKCGRDSIGRNRQSSTSRPTGSLRDGPGIFPPNNEERTLALTPSSSSKRTIVQALQETGSQTDGPGPAQSNLEDVAASVAPTGPTAVEPNVGSIVALLREASLESNSGPLVVLSDVGRAEPNVGSNVAPAQSIAALIVAPPGVVLAQQNIAPNVAPLAPALAGPNGAPNVAPLDVVPVQPAPRAVVAPPAPAQPNVALIVAPPGVARAQPNAAAILAPPAVVDLDVNRGLKRSRLTPLRICEIGSEGHLWPKLPRN